MWTQGSAVDDVEIGIRELRLRLADWIDRASGGETFVITERGRPVARLGPAVEERVLDDLERAGLVSPASRATGGTVDDTPVRATGPIAELVADQRR